MNRRRFITGLGALVGIVAAEPVRRYWAVGANLSRSKAYDWDKIRMTINGQRFDLTGVDGGNPLTWDAVLKGRQIFADDPGPMIVTPETYRAITHGPLPCTFSATVKFEADMRMVSDMISKGS